ncbi:MAG: hypothetical protein ACI9CP_001435 [Cryomorphaceae bacterium]|jgi:hypothetical protein
MKHLLIIGFLIGLAQYSAGQSRLSDNETIQESFTTPEIEDLQMLFDYFNESVCSEQHSDDLNTCYSDFFKRMEQTKESGEFDINISFDRQKGVYKAFKDSTFYRIWSFRDRQEYDLRESTQPKGIFKTVFFAHDDKYLDFVKRTAASYERIEFYYDSILAEGGDIGPGLFGSMLLDSIMYNVDDTRVKFIVAIHYLTLNDQYKRDDRKE